MKSLIELMKEYFGSAFKLIYKTQKSWWTEVFSKSFWIEMKEYSKETFFTKQFGLFFIAWTAFVVIPYALFSYM